MLASPILNIYSVTLAIIIQNTLCIPFSTVTSGKTVKTKALINSGAGGTFIDQKFARHFKIQN